VTFGATDGQQQASVLGCERTGRRVCVVLRDGYRHTDVAAWLHRLAIADHATLTLTASWSLGPWHTLACLSAQGICVPSESIEDIRSAQLTALRALVDAIAADVAVVWRLDERKSSETLAHELLARPHDLVLVTTRKRGWLTDRDVRQCRNIADAAGADFDVIACY
jgi:hypothetical protein